MIGPPSIAASVGHDRPRAPATALHPRPSSTQQHDRLGRRAPVRAATPRRRAPSSAGTRPAIDAPSSRDARLARRQRRSRAPTIGAPVAARCAAERRRRSRDDGGMKVSTRGDYAARALLSLALHGNDRPTSVKEIAERTHLPQPYLEQILLSVKGAGLVRSKRGVGGGYVLARPPERDHARRDRRRGRGPATPDGRAPRPLRGPLRPAGGVGRRRRRDARRSSSASRSPTSSSAPASATPKPSTERRHLERSAREHALASVASGSGSSKRNALAGHRVVERERRRVQERTVERDRDVRCPP